MPLSIVEFIGGVVEGGNLLRVGFAGWRYLFSSAYRHHTHQRWKSVSGWRVFFDIVGGCFGFALSLLGATVTIYALVWWIG